MAHAWKACWGQPLASSNLASSARSESRSRRSGAALGVRHARVTPLGQDERMARPFAVTRDVSRTAARRVRAAARADGADRSGLAALISVHALHAAGDALVAVALAGTLFFNVPLGEARTSVGLYLLLTMLPFTLLVPVAGPLLDRFPHGRRNVLAVTTGGRGLLTWVMAGATASLGLYPLALAVLVLSRAYGVARSAAVPRVRPPAVGLVSANARLNVASVAAASAAAGVGSAMVAIL